MDLRIGILQCDHVAEELQAQHGNYPEMFSQLIHNQDQDIEICTYDLTANQFPVDLSACDGYIITGSQFSAYDELPWIHKTKNLIQQLDQQQIPTIGICFGHQLIAEALGGKVAKAQDKGWGVGVHHWQVTEKPEWMDNTDVEQFAMRASHQDQVINAPPESVVFASSDFCPVAGFQFNKLLTFQGHPEFSRDYAEALINKRVARIGESRVTAARNSLKHDVDADLVAQWMISFIQKHQ